ncbi:hypothetical protein ACEPAH_6618 [Sanghuangporus vaninii]
MSTRTPASLSMSDSRYPPHSQVPHAQYAASPSYAAPTLAGGYPQRSPYSTGQPNYAPSFPTSQFPVPQRSMTPSLAGHTQAGYPQSVPRHRTQSVAAVPATPSGNYVPSQSPSMLGHHRTQSHLQTSQLEYMTANPHALSPEYLQGPSTSNQANYYYDQHTANAQDGQGSATPQRPFPCDMCALSFNRQHDLKRHRDTHSGERPFLCNGGCGKTFTRKDALKRHQLVKNCGRTDD